MSLNCRGRFRRLVSRYVVLRRLPLRVRKVGRRVATAVLAAVAVSAALAGCAPPALGRSGAAPVVYVANSADGTLSRIDTGTGRVGGAAIPAGTAPWKIAAGPQGSLLVLAASPGGVGLTLVSGRSGPRTARRIAVEPGAADAMIAADGGRIAAVAYRRDGGIPAEPRTRCRLALVDLVTGAVLRVLTVCGDREMVVGMAIAGPAPLASDVPAVDLAQTAVYLAIWRRPADGDRCDAVAGNRVASLRFAPDRVADVTPLDGTPGPLVLAGGTDGREQRLHLVRGVAMAWSQPGECDYLSYAEQYVASGRWDVLGLDTTTLEVASSTTISLPPSAIAVTQDGGHLYMLGGMRQLASIDLDSGVAELLAPLPDTGAGLAVAGDQIYVSEPFGSGVWVLDRRSGRVLRTITTGRHPGGLALVAGAS
jgi:YVTN family beta-propeller protein